MEYLWYISRKDFRNLEELLERADNLESISVGNTHLGRERLRNKLRTQCVQHRIVEHDKQAERRQVRSWQCRKAGHWRRDC